MESGVEGSSLLYNEFIVYNRAQVQIKYLVQVNFNWKVKKKSKTKKGLEGADQP